MTAVMTPSTSSYVTKVSGSASLANVVGFAYERPSPPPTVTLKPRPTSGCSPGMRPMSWARTSTQLSFGCAMAILNLRGR